MDVVRARFAPVRREDAEQCLDRGRPLDLTGERISVIWRVSMNRVLSLIWGASVRLLDLAGEHAYP